jgi:choline dehydrogenase-like flavoprotein
VRADETATLVILDAAAGRALSLPASPLVVVGSGAAGIPVALGLADRGHRVVLLESGGDVRRNGAIASFPEVDPEEVQGQSYSGLVDGRARILGGTTQLWVGQCMRLFDIDLRPRPWIPNSGWPLELSDLDHGYQLAERFLGLSGNGYGGPDGRDGPGQPPVAWTPDHLSHTFTEISRRRRLGAVYRRRLAAAPNLWVVSACDGGPGAHRGRSGHRSGVSPA